MPNSVSEAPRPDQRIEDQQTRDDDVASLARQARRLSMWARLVLVPVAVIGAVLSYQSLYTAAQPTFGRELAAGFPLLVDLLILGASLQYVAGAKIGRPMTGWRLTAHCGVAATLVLNALAAKELGEVPWHVTAPAVWAVLVELTGKQVLGQWRATHHGPAASIAPSLWLSAPIESIRTRLLMARTGLADAQQARIGVGTEAAAREALTLSLPRRANARRDARRVRRVVNRQLRAGSLPPSAVLTAVGWTEDQQPSDRSPEIILRAVVQTILSPATAPAPEVLTSVGTDISTSAAAMVLPTGQGPTGPLEPGEESSSPAVSPAPAVPVSIAQLPLDAPAPESSVVVTEPDSGAAEPFSAIPSTSSTVPIPAPATAGGVRVTGQQQQDRLEAAARIVRARPQITGPELRTELALDGWATSERTAARILTDARQQAPALRAVQV